MVHVGSKTKDYLQGCFSEPSIHTVVHPIYLTDLHTIEEPGNRPVGQRVIRPSHWIQPPETCFKINVHAVIAQNWGRRGVAAQYVAITVASFGGRRL